MIRPLRRAHGLATALLALTVALTIAAALWLRVPEPAAVAWPAGGRRP